MSRDDRIRMDGRAEREAGAGGWAGRATAAGAARDEPQDAGEGPRGLPPNGATARAED